MIEEGAIGQRHFKRGLEFSDIVNLGAGNAIQWTTGIYTILQGAHWSIPIGNIPRGIYVLEIGVSRSSNRGRAVALLSDNVTGAVHEVFHLGITGSDYVEGYTNAASAAGLYQLNCELTTEVVDATLEFKIDSKNPASTGYYLFVTSLELYQIN